MIHANFSRLSRIVLILAAAAWWSPRADAQTPRRELLWPDGAPGALGDEPKDQPTIDVWLPAADAATGGAVVVFPGGGYGHLAVDHEGKQIGEWLNSLGVAAFVCEYRHSGRGYRHPAPLQDAQRAVRTVRAQAEEFGVDPSKIGVLGFSAGGHLASSLGTHFDAGDASADDPIERVSCRPDFLVLCYPVITFVDEAMHRGSRRNLLGEEADEELIRGMSSELQVTAKTPPTFLFHTNEDAGVPPENSVLFYLALRRANVPAELHVYEQGRHGLGLAAETPGTAAWPSAAAAWLRGRGVAK